MITIICALAENRAIGLRGNLLYHLRADLRRFKELTTGHTIIMGRRTFESLPKGALPNRRNIVLTRQAGASWPGVEVFGDLSSALQTCGKDNECFIIGGASIYEEALPFADKLCLTHVHDTPSEADVYFPDLDLNEWNCISSERHEADEQNDVPYTFADYVRR